MNISCTERVGHFLKRKLQTFIHPYATYSRLDNILPQNYSKINMKLLFYIDNISDHLDFLTTHPVGNTEEYACRREDTALNTQ